MGMDPAVATISPAEVISAVGNSMGATVGALLMVMSLHRGMDASHSVKELQLHKVSSLENPSSIGFFTTSNR
jgi:hypothetical protein